MCWESDLKFLSKLHILKKFLLVSYRRGWEGDRMGRPPSNGGPAFRFTANEVISLLTGFCSNFCHSYRISSLKVEISNGLFCLWIMLCLIFLGFGVFLFDSGVIWYGFIHVRVIFSGFYHIEVSNLEVETLLARLVYEETCVWFAGWECTSLLLIFWGDSDFGFVYFNFLEGFLLETV